jgi:hypothetical protein
VAYGFRFVPKQRAASPPRPPHCPFCGARYDAGTFPYNWPHICKEVTYSTYVAATKAIPLDGPDEAAGRMLQQIFAAPEHRDDLPYVHTLKLPETEDEMAAEPPPSFTLEDRS